ncbi:MAG TPA: FtsW/RodA/SpoVE family cell cycle protein, partial [Tepidisphaeraceae bacterium]|nr:FtsW/RodA/SpoVE family cell cycle protein [Tepidisphaeraceae bacterium]
MRKLWEQLAIATNWPVLAAVAVLSAVGALSIWVADPQDGLKQLIFLGVSFICMMLFQAVNYQKIGKWSWPFYIFSLLLIIYTLVGQKLGGHLPFVHETKGAWAWINLGPFSLEPAELMKIAFIMVLARYLRFRSNYRTI